MEKPNTKGHSRGFSLPTKEQKMGLTFLHPPAKIQETLDDPKNRMKPGQTGRARANLTQMIRMRNASMNTSKTHHKKAILKNEDEVPIMSKTVISDFMF